jgi:hypothetical protein
MANDWIKMRTDLYRDPKVCVIADLLMNPDGDLARYVDQHCQRSMTVTRNVMRNVTVGALVSLWGVMRLRGKCDGDDLVCNGVTTSVLDDIAYLPGFGEAMVSVGWVVETESGVVFPRFFEDYNVDPESSAKTKAALRQARFRERQKAKSDEVGDVTRDVTVTPREEKRREEKEKKEEPKTKAPRAPRFDAQAHLVSMGVDDKVAEDWLSLRKKKNLAPTATSFEGVLLEAGKAGMTMDQALRTCCTRGWGGFDAAWLDKGGARSGGGGVVPLNRQEALERQNRKIAMEFAQELRHAAI